ncbi:hypothetical protein EBX31_10285, partial [bacterium]|nr:hypothetical protein [bacterium]
GASDSLWAWTVTLAMVVVAVIAPLQGAWSDRTGRRMVLLRGWALLSLSPHLFRLCDPIHPDSWDTPRFDPLP